MRPTPVETLWPQPLPPPTPSNTPPSPQWLYDLQHTLDNMMHFLPQLPDFVPLKNGFYSFRAQTD